MQAFRAMQGILAFALWLACANAVAGYFEGMFALDQGDYQKAYREWSTGAGNGDPKSLYGMGRLYEEGLGVPPDPVRAHVYYELADSSGFPQARNARFKLARRMQANEIARARDIAAKARQTRRFSPQAIDAFASASPTPVDSPAPAKQALATAPNKQVVTPTRKKADPPTPTKAPTPVAKRPPAKLGGAAFEVGYACAHDLRWRDQGSGGNTDVSLYATKTPAGFRSLGSYGQGNYDPPYGCAAVIGPGRGSGGAPLLAGPVDWHRVWTDEGSGAQMDGSIWHAIPPSKDYVCLGSVAQTGYRRPSLPDYVCVHRCMVTRIRLSRALWTDAGTGAKDSVSIYLLPVSNAIVAFPDHRKRAEVSDLAPNPVCPKR